MPNEMLNALNALSYLIFTSNLFSLYLELRKEDLEHLAIYVEPHEISSYYHFSPTKISISYDST